jgi:hypothetical protein
VVSDEFAAAVAKCGEVAVESGDPSRVYLIRQLDVSQTKVGKIVLRVIINREPEPILRHRRVSFN